MPMYRCMIPKGSLNYSQRSEIATAFTDVHCGISNAPRNFVHVQFFEIDEGTSVQDSHGAGDLKFDTPFFIAGGNRAGRPPEVRSQILDGLINRFCEIASVPKSDVSGYISEAPASWSMEDGQILPEPGQEPAEWYAHDAVAD